MAKMLVEPCAVAPPSLDYDDFYAALIKAHEGLSIDQSHALNARLVLLLGAQMKNLQAFNAVLTEAKTYG